MASENVRESEIVGESTVERDAAGSGIDENVAGALSYLFGFVTGVLFFVIDDRPSVRFHAAQSMLLSAAIVGVFVLMGVLNTLLFATLFSGTFIVASALWLVFSLLWGLLGLASFVLWLYMMYAAYTGKRTELPVLGDMADSIAAK